MRAIVLINRSYIQAKGKTFFSNQLMVDNPYTTDGFINDTLEHLRQTARVAVARGDEQQIEQTLQATAALVRVYSDIDYASPHASRTHAHLAAEYLIGQIEQIVPHNMPDVLMEGLRLIGQCADVLLATEGARGTTTLVQKIGLISCVGVTHEAYRPATLTGVEQLARLTLNLIKGPGNLRFAARSIRDSIKTIATLLMQLPTTPLANLHSYNLAPYYSATSLQSLTVQLSELVVAVENARADNDRARQVIENFEEWADGIYLPQKELLLLAIEKRSHFTFDMIHWITAVVTLLIALSNAAACHNHTRGKLRRHATLLISVLDWVPSDKETVTFVENFDMTDTLFKASFVAHERGCTAVGDDIGKLLLNWMFKAGQHHTGWDNLERSVYGLAVLAVRFDDGSAADRLKAEISKRMAEGRLPDKEGRDHSALRIRGRAHALDDGDHGPFEIEYRMAGADRSKLQPLLEQIADIISPDTAGEADDRAELF